MAQFILFEDPAHFDLLPFTFTRPVCDIRSGIFTLRERWDLLLGQSSVPLVYDYLQVGFAAPDPTVSSVWINGKLVATPELVAIAQDLQPNSYLHHDGEVLMAQFAGQQLPEGHDGIITQAILEDLGLTAQSFSGTYEAIRFPEDIFQKNAQLLQADFPLAATQTPAGSLNDPHTRVYGADNIFVAEGAKVRAAILNAEDGPIFLGPGASITEGAIVTKNHAILTGSTVNMGAKLRGDSTIGPHCKVGGEVANSVLFGYANKGHEGYLGNSVLGHWCNLGADTNTSNLKNNYAEVRIWHYPTGRFRKTGTQFCGLMMGDHSKAGINTMFNTGTVVGVSANIFGAGYPRNFIPSFSWGGAGSISSYRLNKALEVAEIVMKRRKIDLSEADKQIMASIVELTAQHRRWEKQPVGNDA
ncbi:putative sugar nucleotidyl transferase [Pontibacter sp. G13]|uniref:putative sugar nucleotidyl transferase n=1 Tax=Pontibacter sp. G13 TaxID=3074898 RepID=UPI00288A16CC|nr:putative sugar nucleotidyl transferase [Pontibacter sp. G13]WNJ18019.1 putative sugar nucleotidyl transferase [Pontibacter sp. G13]